MKLNRIIRTGVFVFLIALTLSFFGFHPFHVSADEPICYVNGEAAGLNNGTSWANAYTDLQSALVQAGPACGVIWVAEGIYKPAVANRAQSFVVQSDVQLYGGFIGTENLLSDREPYPQTNHPTILSGDLGVQDDPADNSYHVIKFLGSAVLDGFVVTEGNSNAAFPNNSGGGIYSICTNMIQTMVLTNLIVTGNNGDDANLEPGYGAGAYVETCQLFITDSLFDNNHMFDSNTTIFGSGGGLALGGGSTLMSTITNTTFHNNSAGSGYGGGIYSAAPLTLTDVTIDHNSAGNSGITAAKSYGGGIYSNDKLYLTNVTFSFNSAEQGGGLYNTFTTVNLDTVTFNDNSALANPSHANSAKGGGMNAKSPVLVNVEFINNSSDYAGGGLFINVGTPQLSRVTFTSNTAYYGGGLYGYTMHGTITDIIFDGNTAELDGGGALLDKGSNPTITKTTFMHNLAATNGGGLFDYSSVPNLTNVTFYDNRADQGGGMANDDNSNATLTYVTFYANIVTIGGGGMANFTGTKTSTSGPSNPIIKDSIFWGNLKNDGITITADQVYNDSEDLGAALAAITYSVVQGGYLGTGNRTGDPLLGTFANYYNSFTKTIPILQGSSAINVGEPLTCLGTDQNGILRPVGIQCDMGAYEAGYRISGNAGVVGATISYFDGTAKTATSDADGNFAFSVSYGYTGRITPSKVGYSFSPPYYDYASSPINADRPNQNFVAYTVITHTISGTLGTNGKGGLVTYTGGSVTANASTGNYTITINDGWSGTITPTKPGYFFAPDHRDYSNVTSNQTNQNFTATPGASLTVIKHGFGTITSSPPGINCGPTCQYNFTYNATVTLTAVSSPLSTFTGWDLCVGTGNCVLTMDVSKTVIATFTPIAGLKQIFLPVVVR